jgi:hypothetical protein
MMVLALLCLYKAKILRELDTDNAVFLYLMWISTGFAVFAVSRSFGHILKQVLVLTGNPDTWQAISPYSGGVNTVSFARPDHPFLTRSGRSMKKFFPAENVLRSAYPFQHLNQTLSTRS